MKKLLDGFANQRVNYKRQKGSIYHPARSCRDLQLDSDDTVESGGFNDSLHFVALGNSST